MTRALNFFATTRIRRSPFWPGVVAAGVHSCSVYNHTLLPVHFRTPEEDYRHLKSRVQLWDVSCQRQVAVRGKDATKTLALFVPRRVESMVVGRCYYIPAVDQCGKLLNDPLVLKLAEDSYWVSIADSDLSLWIKGLKAGFELDVQVWEPDVSPLAVQGPLAGKLMGRVFGEEVRKLRFFGYGRFGFKNRELVISRSGYSRQGGYEIYIDCPDLAMPLWEALMEAGRDLDVGPGSPNYTERIEAGMLSYGGDVTIENDPYECGLGKYCDLEGASDCLAREPLLRIREQGPARCVRSLAISGPPAPMCDKAWRLACGDRFAGRITAASWSWDLETNVAIGMVEAPYWDAGTELTVELPGRTETATVRGSSFT